MKFILVQFQRGKGKEFAGKFYIYKYDDKVIPFDIARGDILENLESTSGYKYNNNAIVIETFYSYFDYEDYCKKELNQDICKAGDIKTLSRVEIFKKEFNIGDYVKVHKPSKRTNGYFGWASSMDKFDNSIQQISDIKYNFHETGIDAYNLKDDELGFSFDSKWFEKVEKPELNSINPGDWVIIHKPKDLNEWPSWIDTMDQYDGTVQKVSEININDEGSIFTISDPDGRCSFNTKWAEKYVEPNFKIGDIVKIHKPKHNNLDLGWISKMDFLDNKISIIIDIEQQKSIDTESYFLKYRTDTSKVYYLLGCWLEKVEDNITDIIDDPDLSINTSCDSITNSISLSDLANQIKLIPTPYLDNLPVSGFFNSIDNSFYLPSNLEHSIRDCTLNSQEKTTENKESEGNNMDFSKMLNVEFGKIANTTEVAACLYGVAIRGSDGRYRAYDKANSKIIDVTGMTFDTDMLFKVPCAISQIGVGDVIINAGNYVTVTNVHKDGTFTVVDPRASEQKIAIPAKNMFGFDFMTKIFYPLDNFFKPTGDNPFGLNPMSMMLLASGDNMDMSTLALMTMMGNGITDQSMMLPMVLMLNQDKTSKPDSMNSLALMMLMGNMGKTNETKTPSAKEKELEEEIEKYRKLEEKMKKVLDTTPVPKEIEPYTD